MYQGFSLTGKNAIVTGASRGIGLSIARGFLQSGANVTICGRKRERLDGAIEQLSQWSQRVHSVIAHVGKKDSIQELIDSAVERFGSIDVLVNNAGTNPYFGPIVDSTEKAWDKTMEVNVRGPYILSREIAKLMKQSGGGSIINIASISGLSAAADQGIYSVSKAALIMLTKTMAKELGEAKIRVNCICPGLVKTQLSSALWNDPVAEKKITDLKALKRIGQADELAGTAIYLASDASSFTTGAMVQVDGGMIL